MGVPYYVDKGFEKVYRGAALDELEKTIESDYIEHLQNGCWKEKQQSKWRRSGWYILDRSNKSVKPNVVMAAALCSTESDLANLGQLYRDERLKQKAESMRLDHCDKLHRLVGRQRGH